MEAQRIAERTNFDMEMLRETGLLFRNRELFQASGGLAAGDAAVYADGLFSG